MTLLDGKSLSAEIEKALTEDIKALAQNGVTAGLAVILVGNDPASCAYVQMKAKACKRVGIYSVTHEMPPSITEDELLSVIEILNNNPNIDGILVQLPLPQHIQTSKILEAINPKKDVDGFNPFNVGRLSAGLDGFVPATPLGVMNLLKAYDIELSGKDVVIVGMSNIVGKPLASLMLNAGASVSCCHILTRDVKAYTRNADIVCVGVGKVGLISADMVKEGAIVIDIGINRLESGALVGDVDFANVAPKTSYITPVPGGVGPMTIATLLQNTYKAARYRLKLQQ
ncbi:MULTISPECIES: bifunctional methylenetetrahydrofolate dehydrogenase/methenyltetrahydrofolate cyclohydrolase FolD [Helicobacter]|uniref:Bifunctional protein FolD n=2 Tax=Helicobacter typhlonius TaxID=76936 RepID=A0A099UG50_9HELI|nr:MULTISPECIES: bifunctional methylenetetrahydrofolate dehydrogenase/methenyltetrahydrofolate cyclohydrolase FolD [Helicobacter]TLD78661.1 bifunctional methylenetetrahydrofolate dehydrogenase/methenyltetrahydrofolate cyclohydrolase FolD [Helicobacter typhlonius]TLD89450.1 bifunctional methylenetetrahydrofolate dehydrogenase/methenyltetrahydrofolate cyclohydrolase FolD [Helicobacter sp. MIT 03-1616]CUU40070.1 Methylenetetrahydrofolate dehydrogenase (NADP+) / Methenyltetrahydrofolate cyclohydrola